MLRDYIEEILENYKSAKNENFSDHPLAAVLRREFPGYLKEITDNSENYNFSGSAGRGNWTYSPWVAVLNKKITDSAQRGYYIVFLFREDMQGVYISLNQGMTEIRNQGLNSARTKQILRSRASDFRELLRGILSTELLEEIDLGIENSPIAQFYEAGNIYAKYYSLENLPSENVLESDFKEFLSLYDSIVKGPEKLKVIEDAEEIEKAQNRFLELIKEHVNNVVTGKAGFQGGQEDGEVYWSDSLGLWLMSRKIENSRYWNGFGTKEPSEGEGLTITCEINIPIEGIRRAVAAAFAKDEKGNVYVVHRGKLGGNFSKKFFQENYAGEWTTVQDGDQNSEVVVIGSLKDPELPLNVSKFVFEVERMKKGEKGIKKFIEMVLTDYLSAKDDKSLGLEFIRLSYGNSYIQEYLKDIAKDPENNPESHLFSSYGDFGSKDNLAYLPYLYLYDKTVADADPFVHQSYILYIFREDMKGAYLSLHLGHNYMEEVMKKEGTFTGRYGDKHFMDKLKIESSRSRAYISDSTEINREFTDKMDLGSENARSAPNYEAANIFSKYYTLENLPSEEDLINDLKEVLKLYNILNSEFTSLNSYKNGFFDFLKEKDYYFPKESVENFLLSVKVKPFVILTGNSGTGKTKIAQLFAQYKSISDSSEYKIVPVGANWTENRHLLGFYNVITKDYQETSALDLIMNAFEDRKVPYLLVLDEMNLSHVERYFADFLSAMESEESIPLHSNDDEKIPWELDIPKNLLVIGTVNVDETTYMFSPKVLDRANTIEFSTYPAKGYMLNEYRNNKPQGNIEYLENPLSDLETRSYKVQELKQLLDKVKIDVNSYLWDVLANEINNFQEVLGKAGFDFGFRVIDEILRFMYVAWVYEGEKPVWDNWMRYFDAQIKQKMLPKLHGSQRVLEDVLKDLFELCYVEAVEPSPRYFENLESDPNVKYLSSALKIQEMDKVLNEQRYVSFIN